MNLERFQPCATFSHIHYVGQGAPVHLLQVDQKHLSARAPFREM
jgi:hypothetical protein